ncbi:MAG: AbrB family transcriptional regulator [Acidobacteria bacterium]|nr:MAG: AbrB family transcriptional regulator [Acidobacteriota bacterium]PIE89248.1 MAG: AbrB family transcriptional regulator [Acidobacteriota bacterium]
MALATVTTKGQITIPKQIRESLKLNTGDKIEIVLTNRMEALIRPISKRVDDVFCKLQNTEREVISQPEIDQAIANRMRRKFK